MLGRHNEAEAAKGGCSGAFILRGSLRERLGMMEASG